jgi:hypothetical protein
LAFRGCPCTCSRRFFAAQLPELMPANQGMSGIFKPNEPLTKQLNSDTFKPSTP